MEPRFLIRFILFFATVFVLLFMVVWFYLSVTQPANAGEPPREAEALAPPAFAHETLTIRTPGGGEHRLRVELAQAPEQHRFGLMFRESLAPDAGMLFIYEPARPVTMWMKNTQIPLDMLFADADGRVFHIHENARPHDESLIMAANPHARTAYVLELPAGAVARLGLAPGDMLVRP